MYIPISLGHPIRFFNAMGMACHVFLHLIAALNRKCFLLPTKYVSIEEQVAIFLQIAKTGMENHEH